MENIFLKQLASKQIEGAIQQDLNSPFSFIEWKQRRPTYTEEDVIYHYNQYVVDWFNRNKNKPISQKFLLRQKYLYLLSQLQLFFSEEEKNEWYNKVNIADEKELLLAIPYFAKKLKAISLYYLKLRKKLKNVKLKYNLVGTEVGLEQEIQHRLMEVFSDLNTELPPEIANNLPTLETLRDNLTVKIEQLYDDSVYFDRDTTVALSAYYDPFHDLTAQFFATKGLSLSSDDWAFNSLNIPAISGFDVLFANLSSNIFELSETTLYGDFVQKFLGESKFTSTFNSPSATIETTDVSLVSGNNYFYYPFGVSTNTLTFDGIIPNVQLSSISIGGATSGSTLETADTMFVKNGDLIKAAWLHFKQYEDETHNLRAQIKQDSSTAFIFPFPGYGLSAEDIEWTGPSLSSTQGYQFLTKQYKNAVNEAYWSQILPADQCEPLLLNNTTLVSGDSFASKNPNLADRIFIRTDRVEDNTTPNKIAAGAWLYENTRTSIPITSNTSLSTIIWPYQYISSEAPLSAHLENFDFSGSCDVIHLSSLDVPFGIASDRFENADKIYKLSRYSDLLLDATECCWLSGRLLSADNYLWSEQGGFSVLLSAGTTTRFVWNGPNNTPLSSVFGFVNHSSTCPFTTSGETNPTKCSCKQVYYAPYGHAGAAFEENEERADFVVADTKNELELFDLGSWKDESGNDFKTSERFSWFNTLSSSGWGNGSWKTKGAPLLLETGKAYFYRRTPSIKDFSYPSYVVNYKFPTNNTQWIQAKKNASGEWVSADVPATTNLVPGNFLKWDRKQNTTYYLLSTQTVEFIPQNLYGSAWAIYDTIPLSGTQSTITISWPDNSRSDSISDPQYPFLGGLPVSFGDVVQLFWWKITHNETNTSFYVYDSPILTLDFSVSGTYSFEVSASLITGEDFYFTDIPVLSVVPQFEDSIQQIEQTFSSSGFIIQQPLTNSKPFWAILDVEKNETTRFKSVYSWGYPNRYIEDYLPNQFPEISPIVLQYGDVIDYQRRGLSFEWNQPLKYKKFDGKTQWCQITGEVVNTSSLSSIYDIKNTFEPAYTATTIPTDIVLTNFLNGKPVEIYYNALNSFVWQVSVETFLDPQDPTVDEFFRANQNWQNLSNRFYPTIATVPITQNLYSEEDSGGFFTQAHLGASQYINNNFTSEISGNYYQEAFLTEDNSIHIGGRGLTKKDQTTPFQWTENNQWLKEPPTSNQLAGSVKKSLTKSLQTFVPYQNSEEQKQFGLVTPSSRVTPWGGEQENEWKDTINEPKSFTGVRSVSAWIESQVLKQNQKVMDSWVTDIFGNQYGLFKNVDENTSIYDRSFIPGQLWVKENDQLVEPGYASLSSVFEPFKTINNTIYKQLTGEGIVNFDCFFDTLMFETSSIVIYSKITYNYDTGNIVGLLDNTRFKYLTKTNNSSVYFGQSWFLGTEKILNSLYVTVSSGILIPEIYELNLTTGTFRNSFPFNSQESQLLSQGLSGLNVKAVDRPLLTYSKILNQFLISIPGLLTNDEQFLVNIIVNRRADLTVESVTIYTDTKHRTIPFSTQVHVLSNYFYETVPLTFTPTDTVQIYNRDYTTLSVSAINDPTYFELVNFTSNVTAFNDGTFITYFENPGVYHVNYKVGNDAGFNLGCLTLSAMSREDVILLNGETGFLVLDGYNGRYII